MTFAPTTPSTTFPSRRRRRSTSSRPHPPSTGRIPPISRSGRHSDATQLDAAASVSGDFVYTPGSGTVLRRARPNSVGDVRARRLRRLPSRHGDGDDQRPPGHALRQLGESRRYRLRHGPGARRSSTRRRPSRAHSSIRPRRERPLASGQDRHCRSRSRPPTPWITHPPRRPRRSTCCRRVRNRCPF